MYINCHTYYSFQYGTLSVQELVQEARRCNVRRLALTEINNTASYIEMLRIKGDLEVTVGESLVEDDQIEQARSIMDKAHERRMQLLLPQDVVVADEFEAKAQSRVVSVDEVPDGWRIMDVGPRSIVEYGQALQPCKTVVWNGPLGVAEFPQFARGSESLANILADIEGTTIVGGGETAALVQEAGLADRFDHVSTGGGAFLEFLEGRDLPGVAALLDK